MITELVSEALSTIEPKPVTTLDDIHQADAAARNAVKARLQNHQPLIANS